MRTIFGICIMILVALTACEKNTENIPSTNNIINNWQLVGHYSPTGDGSVTYSEIESGDILSIRDDNSFIITSNSSNDNGTIIGCSEGIYSLEEDLNTNLSGTIDFGCDDPDSSIFRWFLNSKKNTLSIRDTGCIEGCTDVFKLIIEQ